MSKVINYPKAKMPNYGDGPEPCEDCAIKDKRIAELEKVLNKCIEPVAYASDRAHDNNAETLSNIYASIMTWICRVLSEGDADE